MPPSVSRHHSIIKTICPKLLSNQATFYWYNNIGIGHAGAPMRKTETCNGRWSPGGFIGVIGHLSFNIINIIYCYLSLKIIIIFT